MPHMKNFLHRIDPLLRVHVEAVAAGLRPTLKPGDVVVLAAENSWEWIHVDLALQVIGAVVIPLPGFFTAEQTGRVLENYPVKAIIGDQASVRRIDPDCRLIPAVGNGWVMTGINRSESAAHPSEPDYPPGAKLTFTSGSTGDPKAVIITSDQQWLVAEAIAQSLMPLATQSHLVMLPLPVLLENVAGVYGSLLLGSRLLVPPQADVGLSGSSSFDPGPAVEMIRQTGCETLILLPFMLQLLVAHLAKTLATLPSLRYVAVGGGRVSPSLLEAASAVGLPVYEGYGLTEACSVVCMNTPWQQRRGSVGRPLPHQKARLADDGEILIGWSVFQDCDEGGQEWFATGDIGVIDPEGYVYISGRKKNLIITGYGRNVSPEWPESILLEHGEIAQAMVYGDGDPHLSALLVPRYPETTDAAIEEVVAQTNTRLPDYARIRCWKKVRPFTAHAGFLTPNGRLRRERIAAAFCLSPDMKPTGDHP